nr:MAG TPA: hypothetical protein [Bacteriophage sp.]
MLFSGYRHIILLHGVKVKCFLKNFWKIFRLCSGQSFLDYLKS